MKKGIIVFKNFTTHDRLELRSTKKSFVGHNVLYNEVLKYVNDALNKDLKTGDTDIRDFKKIVFISEGAEYYLTPYDTSLWEKYMTKENCEVEVSDIELEKNFV